ncbi:unnamed protein product, partial [Mesorhabditis belari]|uniref:Uncharacterized protein n=1 Tax=Mesorhabditis belari TaxID=2138241 RepID=A0AAF3F8K1_9BILA
MSRTWNLDAPTYVPMGTRPPFVEKSTEEFRAYLEEHGVTEAFTRALVQLKKTAPEKRPEEPLDFIAHQLGHSMNNSIEDELLNNILEDFLDRTDQDWKTELMFGCPRNDPELVAIAMHIIQSETGEMNEVMPTSLDHFNDTQMRALQRQLADLSLKAAVQQDGSSPTSASTSTPRHEKVIEKSPPTSIFSSPDSGIFEHNASIERSTKYWSSKSFAAKDFGTLF